ncbi:MAG: hypothetical protein ACTSX9_05585 [Candidatus Njordarchaeales archaeon]
MIHLLYIANEDGTPIWHFVHPKIREDILDKIAGKDHAAITNLLYALATFGYETLGTNLQVVVFENAKITFRFVKMNERNLLVVAVIDLLDHPSTVWRILSKFIKKCKNDLEALARTSEELVSTSELEKAKIRLTRTLTELLEGSIRKIIALGTRDFKNLTLAFFLGLIFYFAMVGVTYWFYKFTSMGNQMSTFAALVFLLDFLLPAVFIGWVTGYWKGAIINSLIVMVIALNTLAIIWWDALVAVATYFFSVSPQAVIVGVGLVGGILGGAMGLLAGLIAWLLVERRVLVPPLQ